MGHAIVFDGGEASAQEGANIQSCSRLASAVREYWQRLTAKYWTPPPLCSVARSTSLSTSSVSDSRLLFCILVSAANPPTDRRHRLQLRCLGGYQSKYQDAGVFLSVNNSGYY